MGLRLFPILAQFLLVAVAATGCDADLRVATNSLPDCVEERDGPCEPTNKTEPSYAVVIEKASFKPDSNTIVVDWPVLQGKDKTTIGFSQDSDCSPVAFEYELTSGIEKTLGEQPEGVYYLCFEDGIDGKALKDESGAPYFITIDRSPPILSGLTDLITNQNVTLSPTVDDLSATTASWDIVSGPTPPTFSPANAASTVVSFSIDGTYVLRLSVMDAGNRKTTQDLTVVFDTLPPTVDAGSDKVANVSWTQNGTVSGDAVRVKWSKVSGPGSILFGGDENVSTTIAATMDGDYVIRLTAYDAAGNAAEDDFTLTWNTSGPYFASLARSNEASDGFIHNGEKGSVNKPFTLNAVGYTSELYSGFLASSTVCDGSVTYTTATMPAISDLPSDGTWVVCVKLSDTALNEVYGKSQTVTRDVVAPVFTSLDGINAASNGYVNAAEVASSDAMFTLSATGHDAVSYTVVLADSALTCDGTKAYNESSIPIITDIPAMDGAYAVCVRLADHAGNVVYGKSETIIRDTNIPTVDVGTDVTTNVSVTLDADTSGGNTYQWSETSATGNVTFGTATAEDTTVSASDDGTYVLRLTVTDAAGNSASGDLIFIWDTDAPTFTSLALANEASNGYVNAAETSSTSAAYGTLTATIH